jgi:hypothetical protein
MPAMYARRYVCWFMIVSEFKSDTEAPE